MSDATKAPASEELINEDNQQSRKRRCIEQLSRPDAVMDVDIVSEITSFMQNGGDEVSIINMLTDNYHGYAQMVNLLQGWLILAGESKEQVREVVQAHVKKTIMKSFDSETATAKLFENESGAPQWLRNLIGHEEWRKLIYDLSEENKSSLMLNFVIKLISDAGFQTEIASVSTVANQLEVFSAVLANAISLCLKNADDENVHLKRITSMASINQCTYLYCQALLHACMSLPGKTAALKRLSQECALVSANRGPLVARYTLLFSGATHYPDVLRCLSTICESATVTEESIRIIHDHYALENPPPVSLIRLPIFMDILVKELFAPGVDRTNESITEMCSHVLAYAASVDETGENINSDLFAGTDDAIKKVVDVCKRNTLSPSIVEMISVTLEYPVIAMGLLFWLKVVLLESDFFVEFAVTRIPPHFVLIDQIAVKHPALRSHVLKLLVVILECTYNIDVLLLIELKRQVLDRMLYVLALGYVMPVVEYVKGTLDKMDLSLVVHFVIETSGYIGGPFSPKLVQSMLVILGKKGVIKAIRRTDSSLKTVNGFLKECLSLDNLEESDRATVLKLQESLTKRS